MHKKHCIGVHEAGIYHKHDLYGRNEHVRAIEIYIITIKERLICVKTTIPLKKLPERITIKPIAASIFWLNIFPKIAEAFEEPIPRYIITG